MKDFTYAQKLLMALAVFVAVTFAVLMGAPGQATDTAPSYQPSGINTPF